MWEDEIEDEIKLGGFISTCSNMKNQNENTPNINGQKCNLV